MVAEEEAEMRCMALLILTCLSFFVQSKSTVSIGGNVLVL
jgi:hypothetical protein